MKGNVDIKQLISRIAADDSTAFGEFYDLFYLKVYRFSGYFVKSDICCEEIVSDTFYSIWQSRKNLSKIENIEAYLYTATRNKALYHVNHNSTDKNILIEDLPIGYTIHEETPESIIITKETIQELKNAIKDLPERCKLIFLMAKEEGLKYKEIAKILSISEKTVNAQMVIALKRIVTALRRHIHLLLIFSIACLK